MAIVTPLQQVESVKLDPARLCALNAEFGPAETERVLERAMEEMALLTANMVGQYRQNDFQLFSRNLRSLRRMAEHVGMSGFARITGDVAQCLDAGDGTAFAATWARLLRAGARSFPVQIDLRGISG